MAASLPSQTPENVCSIAADCGNLGSITTRTKTRTTPNRITFSHRGRSWSLARRGAVWYLVSEHKGRRLHESCGETAQKAAVIIAKLKIDALLDGNRDAARLLMRRSTPEPCSTIAELMAALSKLVMNPATERSYKFALHRVLTLARPDLDPDSMTCALFTSDTAARYWMAQEQAVAGKPQAEAQRAMNSAIAMFRNARAVVAPRTAQKLALLGIRLPDLTGWTKYRAPETSQPHYIAPPQDLIRRTVKAWLKLPRNEFIVVGLELSCGLRIGTIASLTWQIIEDAIHGQAAAHTKDGSGLLRIAPIDPFWRVLMRRVRARGWNADPTAYVIEGTEFDRQQKVFENVGAWMRGLGWTTRKTNHAFRAYAGSLVLAMGGQPNIYRASRWLHHKSVVVTEKHYTYFVDDLERRKFKTNVKFARIN